MINQNKLVSILTGNKAHRPNTDTLVSDGDFRSATCLDCNQTLSSYYNDDSDRLTGWTAWRATSPCVA
jgi:hypothetical protein